MPFVSSFTGSFAVGRRAGAFNNSAPAWSPSTDITTAVWFDASDTSSYTLSGSNVTAVTDKSGNATVTVNGTPDVGTTLNGYNTFTFDSNNNEDFITDEFAQVSNGNHWAVGLFKWNGVNNVRDSLWSTENNTVASGSKRDYSISASNSSLFEGELDLDGLSSNRISTTIGDSQDFDNGLMQNTWSIVAVYFNKTGNQIGARLQGANAFTPVNDYDNSLPNNLDLRIMRNRASVRMDGKMAEFFSVADVPGTGGTDISTLEKAEGYLAHKWNQQSRLDSGHPYKSSAP